MVVSLDRAETIRSHHDMEKDNELCRFTKKASKFYEEYAQKAVKNGHTGTMMIVYPRPMLLFSAACAAEPSGL